MSLKKYAPHIIAFVVFALISIIQYKPYLFDGKTPYQSDISQYGGISKEITDYRNTYHEEPLWTNSCFGGMPAYQISAIYKGNWISFLDKVFHLFLPGTSGYIFMYFFGFFILMLCLKVDPWLAFIGSLAYGFSSYFFIILEVGHNTKANALGYLPAALGGLILLVNGKYRIGFAVTLLFMALELNTNHLQIIYYGFMLISLILLVYFIYAVREKKVKPFLVATGLFLLASGLSVLPNAANMLATYEYGKYSTRGATELTIDETLKTNKDNKTSGLDKDYATQYSYGTSEIFTFLIPNFKGGVTEPIYYSNEDALKNVDPNMQEQVGNSYAYYGPQSLTAGPVYIGAVVMLLAFLGLLISDHKLKWPLFIGTMLAVMLSWGKYFMGFSNIFFDYFPGYDKFRSVSMILILAELAIPILAVLAIDKLLRTYKENKEAREKKTGLKASAPKPAASTEPDANKVIRKRLLIAFAVIGGFCLLCYITPSSFTDFQQDGEQAKLTRLYKQNGATDDQLAQFMPTLMNNIEMARIEIFREDALRSFIFVLLAFGVIYLFISRIIKSRLMYGIFALLIVVDMWPVARRYFDNKDFGTTQNIAEPKRTTADDQILADKSLDYRVLNLTVSPFMDGSTSYYHKSIGGYHGAKLKKFDEMISFHLFGEIGTFQSGIYTVASDSALRQLTTHIPVLNMLNTKYIIMPGKEDPIAITNPNANGNAWFVSRVMPAVSADSEIVNVGKINTHTTALVRSQLKQSSAFADTYDTEGEIKLLSYKPNDLVYESNANGKRFAVFSEIYYPKGWNAYIDGKETPYVCTDYLLRGMEIPAGKHQVEFKFEPSVYRIGNIINLIGSIIVLLGSIALIYIAVKKEEVTV